MKIIAFYLPQFHEIKENDEWWGKGFTEWTNVKKAKPIFAGHYQPKIPLNNNYYNLLDDNVKIWQAQLAKKYGIYGFCYYHYWYNGHMLLEKPMEQMLANERVDIPFCICWANEPWTKIWSGKDKKILIPQLYGGEQEWSEHFNYLKQFFLDKRYIVENNKPMILIYRAEVIPCIKEMLKCWNDLAIREGFDGIKSVCVTKDTFEKKHFEYFDNICEWQPAVAINLYLNIIPRIEKKNIFYYLNAIRRSFYKFLENKFGYSFYKYSIFAKLKYSLFAKFCKKELPYNVKRFECKDLWEKMVQHKSSKNNVIPGSFIRFDNTPRYQGNASITLNDDPEVFKTYFKKQIINARDNYKSDKLFFFAWNEWAEGAMLEPDERYGYKYLNSIKEALIETNEFEC